MAQSTRLSQLQNLANRLPAANQQVAQGLQAAQDTALQESIRQASPAAGPRAAQALGAQQAGQTGQTQLQTAQQTQQQLGQVGQLGLQQQATEAQQRLGTQRRAGAQEARDLQSRLAELDQEAKDTLVDRQMRFQEDQAGQTLLNERQLADWAVANAKSQNQFNEWARQTQQLSQKKLYMLEAANKRLLQALSQEAAGEKQKLDQASLKKIAEAQRALQEKLAREKAKAGNRAAMFQAGGTILGAAAGAAIGTFAAPGVGTAAGASAGASLGGGVGTAAGGATA